MQKKFSQKFELIEIILLCTICDFFGENILTNYGETERDPLKLLLKSSPNSVTNLSPLTLGLLYEEFSIHIEIVEWTVSDVPRETFTQSPSVSNNPKIPTYYLIFAVVEWTLSNVPREASQISELRTTGRKCLGLIVQT